MIDVLVIGGGNAALCAALMAREAGASVLLLEAAPREWRGGNSQHTRNLRCMHDAPQDVLVDAYPEEEFWQDLLKVTGGRHRREAGAPGDPRLVELPRLDAQARRALPAVAVGHAAPVAHQRLLHGRRQGAGQRLLPQRRSAGRAGPLRRAGRLRSSWRTAASSRRASAAERIEAKACVLAAGGFESNREWLREAWGQNERGEWPADNFLIRGTRFNQGVLLKFMMDAGADIIGDPSQSHCVAIDARAPLYDGGICTRVDCVSLGVMLNRDGAALLRRGRGLLAQALRDLGPAGGPAARPDRLLHHRQQGRRPLHAAGLPRRAGARPCPSWRASWACPKRSSCKPLPTSTRPAGSARSTTRCSTTATPRGCSRAKTHWARPIDTPPFFGYALRPGITFTYLGLKTDEHAAVHFGGVPSANLFVAGEMMAGNVLGQGYTAGVGMSIGTAFGRIAGTQAAAAALKEGAHAAA